jgi:hypothetical protein
MLKEISATVRRFGSRIYTFDPADFVAEVEFAG